MNVAEFITLSVSTYLKVCFSRPSLCEDRRVFFFIFFMRFGATPVLAQILGF